MSKPAVTFVSLSDGQREVKRHWKAARVMFLLGAAGTGKTHAALAMALEDVFRQKRRVMLARPLVTCDEDMGFLPGDVNEKLLPWMGPFVDVLGEMTDAKWGNLSASIDTVPVGMLRGRTVRDATLIVDEAQNLTYSQLKCALTRVGENGRVVLCGDPDQSDRYDYRDSPLLDVAERLEDADFCRVVRFREDQIVRDPVITEILRLL